VVIEQVKPGLVAEILAQLLPLAIEDLEKIPELFAVTVEPQTLTDALAPVTPSVPVRV
jgi:hypothetical protein